MSLRYLFGPVRDPHFDTKLPRAVGTSACVLFQQQHLRQAGYWDEFLALLPKPFQPDFLVLDLPYLAVPPWVWSAPIPLVGLAGDGSLLWHALRQTAPLVDLLLADAPTCERLERSGFDHVRTALLYGVEEPFVQPEVETPRDIDLLFCGNLHPAVQRERLPWLQRLARLGERWKVVVASGPWHDAYRALLRRSRIVFNRSVRSEWNLRVGEVLGAGCLLLQERSNRETSARLREGRECVTYSEDDLEAVVEHYLSHEEERQTIARLGRARAAEFTFEAFWQATLLTIERERPLLEERARRRCEQGATATRAGRVWRALSAGNLATDPSLYGDLLAEKAKEANDADLHHALGMAVTLMAQNHRLTAEVARQAADHFRQALRCNPHHLPAALNFTEVLVALRQDKNAIDAARRLVSALDRDAGDSASLDEAPHFPTGYDLFQVEWEQIGWDHAGDLASARKAKRRLMLWRLHFLLAELTGDLSHHHEAVLARPDLPLSRAALGCALGRAGKRHQAVTHLRVAVQGNPFDKEASRALYQALLDSGQKEEASRVASDRRLLRQACGDLVLAEEWFYVPPKPRLRLETLALHDFNQRYGNANTARALHGFTPAEDTHVVLTLLAHQQAQRIVEIGTAAGHMTANLTEWSPDDATVYTLGITAEMQGACKPEQQYEAPPRAELGKHANHFGKGEKVCFVTADSLTYDFRRLAPLDFAFIDGAHDLKHVLSDTRNVYENLRPGGCMVWHDFNSPTPWVEVRQALEQAQLPEPILHVAGTQVAFLVKQGRETRDEGREGRETATEGNAKRASSLVPLTWEGGFSEEHSLALVNRELTARLLERGYPISLKPHTPTAAIGTPSRPLSEVLASRIGAALPGPAQVHVRHFWPPDLTPPAEGRWVIIQPWEFGSLPRAWLAPFRDVVDEIWVPSHAVKEGYVDSGLSADRVRVVPNGVDTHLFHPEAKPFPLQTKKAFKFLFVGGTIHRKGIDLLLRAYTQAFKITDDVCLVIKDMGITTFYQGQTHGNLIEDLQKKAFAPEIEYLTKSLSPQELAGLYTACDCLVLPYRGEGFGLPLAEAMASGKPVVVTGHGAALDFCDDSRAYLIPAQVIPFKDNRIGNIETVKQPWLAEPSLDALTQLLRHVLKHPDEARTKGKAARDYVCRHLTWDHAATVVEERLRDLVSRPIRRISTSSSVRSSVPSRRCTTSLVMIVKNEEKNLGDCLNSVAGLFPEVIVLDTGSTDRTREIATACGAKVFEFPWVNDFAAARNESLRHATGDYVFWMDADDRLDADNREKLRRLLENLRDVKAAYSMKCLCLPDPVSRHATVVDHVRLFRRLPGVGWQYRVHEQILGSLRRAGCEVRFTDIVIHHVGYVDPALRARKLQRDLSILELEDRDRPDDPFTLFNLGSVYQELGQHEKALEYLRRSLKRSAPNDSIVRKLYALIAGSLNLLGRTQEALATCREGLAVTPDDAELLIRSARLSKKLGNYSAAESALLILLSTQPDPHFASVDPDLRGWLGRHELADVLYRQARYAEARAHWQAVVKDRPGCLPAWYGLAEIALTTGNEQDLEAAARQIESYPEGAVTAGVFRGRLLLNRNQYEAARQWARTLIEKHPQEVGPRELLADAYLREGTDLRAAEQVLREILLLDPGHKQTMSNLAVLLRQRLMKETAVFEEQGSILGWVLGERYDAACLKPSALNEHLMVLHELARECKHVTDMGTGEGTSALAFLWAQPETLILVDLVPCPALNDLEALAGRSRIAFRRGDSLQIDLEETDLLFLDTRHDAEQLRGELERHASKARKYLVLHGTTRYAEKGESEEGIGPVVEAFLARGTFGLKKCYDNNEGLAVLERVTAPSLQQEG